MVKFQTIRSDYERYSKLAEIEEKNAEAFIKQLQLALQGGKKRERLISLGINLLAGLIIFALGVFAGPWLTRTLHLVQELGPPTTQP